MGDHGCRGASLACEETAMNSCEMRSGRNLVGRRILRTVPMPHATISRGAARRTRTRRRRARSSAAAWRSTRRVLLALQVAPSGHPDRRRDGPPGDGLGGGELDGAGGPQADGSILPGQRLAPQDSGADLAANMARSSPRTPQRSSRRNCWPHWPRWRAAATRWPGPIGDGVSVGTHSRCTGRPRAPRHVSNR